MGKSIAIDARIDEELNERLSRLSETTGRSRAALVAEAIRSYVESEAAFAAAVKEGLADAEAGHLTSHAAVIADFERRRRFADGD